MRVFVACDETSNAKLLSAIAIFLSIIFYFFANNLKYFLIKKIYPFFNQLLELFLVLVLLRLIGHHYHRNSMKKN